MSDTTPELKAALEREAATREILRVINRSPGDYQPVFEAILENAARLCDAPLGLLLIREEDGFHFVAERGCRPETMEYFRANPLPLDPEHSVTARTAVERRPIQVPDLTADPLSQTGQPHRRLGIEVEGVRTQLTVPMLRGDECVGVIIVYRREVRAFDDDQVALLSSFADQAVIANEHVRRFKALGESLERQTATSEILRAISRSPTDYAPVFETILENATRLCGAPFGVLFLVKDDHLHVVANLGANPEFIDFLKKSPLPLVRHATASNAVRQRVPIQNVDVADETYRAGDPIRVFTVDVGGVRTLLAVPLLKGDETLGVIALYRHEVKPFADDDIALVSTFADQAAIAIENVRQFRQVQARTADLTRSLERQTATSEILRTISHSPTDYSPTFDTILGNAIHLCGAPFGTLFLLRDGYLQVVADVGSRPESIEHLRAHPIALDEPHAVTSRTAREQVPTQVADLMDEKYLSGDPRRRATVELGGIRTFLGVPMLKGNETLGVIALYRQEVKPFADNDIALVRTFADQAVIAIENVRSFQQVQARTNDLTQSLERQTATSEILRVISRSPDDYQPVFDAILQNAVRLCRAPFGSLFLVRDDHLHFVADVGSHPEFIEYLRANPYPLDHPVALVSRAARERAPRQIEDLMDDAYRSGEPVRIASVKLGQMRTLLGVPILKNDETIGLIALYRREVDAFSDSEIDLVRTFADQAVIAIENVRQFQAVQERTAALTQSLERQTATSEILRAINRSPTDYQPVFDVILVNALRLCRAPRGNLLLLRDGHLHLVSSAGETSEFIEHMKANPLSIDRPNSVTGRAAREQVVVNVPDMVAELLPADAAQLRVLELSGTRSLLAVPILRGDITVGVLALYRQEVKAFADDDVELVRTFADQAVIAIENVRSFQQVQARTADLTQSLERQTATSEILRAISQSPTDYDPVFDTILQNATRLCGAPFGVLYLLRDDHLHMVADTGSRPDFLQVMRDNPIPMTRPDPGPLVRAALKRATVQFNDILDDIHGWTDQFRTFAAEVGKIRTLLGVPLVKGGTTVGVIALFREEVQAFTDDEIQLVATFADQAIIAIENVRSFQQVQARTADLTQSLERQTATSEILRTISQSPTDYAPVFDTILQNAVRLCGAPFGTLFLLRDDYLHALADAGSRPEFIEYLRANPFPLDHPTSYISRTAREQVPVLIADLRDEAYRAGDPRRVTAVETGGLRTQLTVPMLKGDKTVGVVALYRQEVKPFADEDIDLVTTFADQAVIAIENVRLFQALEERNAALNESLERQTATSEILRTISQSPTDYGPVFDAILDNATRLCDAPLAFLLMREGDAFHLVAHRGSRPEFIEFFLANPLPADSRGALAAVAGREGVPMQLEDITDNDAYRSGSNIHRVASADIEGIRTALFVPMMKGKECVGIIALYRREVRAFQDSHLALVSTFADQAVIAIDNVRLFQTLEARTAALTRTLERQTATSEILRVISRSPTDYAPVFQTILDNAIRLCGAPFGALLLVRDGHFEVVADVGVPPEYLEYMRANPHRLDNPVAVTSRAAREQVPVQVVDMMNADYESGEPLRVKTVKLGGIRTLMCVPMLKSKETVGVVALFRQEVKPFSDDDIELVSTFADQAVIAIENVRLFQALESRTNDLSELLERQTATSEILRSISRSPTDYQPVFDTILQNGIRLCDAHFAGLFLLRDRHLALAASLGGSAEFVEFARAATYPIDMPGSLTGRAARERVPQHEVDVRDSDRYRTREKLRVGTVELGGIRTMLAVPLCRGEETLGVLALFRQEVRAFGDDEIELVRTFADQAVIAMENVRLFQTAEARSSELAKSVAELEALGDVAQAVSSSLDLETVLDTIVERAVQLSGASLGAINELDEATGTLPPRAAPGAEEMLELPAPRLGEGAVGRAAATRTPVQIPDITVPGAYTGQLLDALSNMRIRALLAVPMVQDDSVLGTLVVARRTPGEFPAETVRVLQALGTQSAIAIRNARLFREIEEQSRELEAANRHKSEFLANMSHELRTPLNAVIGFSEVLGERMFGELNDKQAEYVTDIHDSGRHLLSLINDILDLSKIEAGAMELDVGRFALGPALDNALTLVKERAGRRGIALASQFAGDLGEMEGDERKLKQILLNLLSNAIKFTDAGGKVTLEAMGDGTSVHIAVRDTGVGISLEDQSVIFDEFKQVGTDYARKVEGTGLGLTLTRRFVEMHGGSLSVESEPGVGSVFRVTLPLRPPESQEHVQ